MVTKRKPTTRPSRPPPPIPDDLEDFPIVYDEEPIHRAPRGPSHEPFHVKKSYPKGVPTALLLAALAYFGNREYNRRYPAILPAEFEYDPSGDVKMGGEGIRRRRYNQRKSKGRGFKKTGKILGALGLAATIGALGYASNPEKYDQYINYGIDTIKTAANDTYNYFTNTLANIQAETLSYVDKTINKYNINTLKSFLQDKYDHTVGVYQYKWEIAKLEQEKKQLEFELRDLQNVASQNKNDNNIIKQLEETIENYEIRERNLNLQFEIQTRGWQESLVKMTQMFPYLRPLFENQLQRVPTINDIPAIAGKLVQDFQAQYEELFTSYERFKLVYAEEKAYITEAIQSYDNTVKQLQQALLQGQGNTQQLINEINYYQNRANILETHMNKLYVQGDFMNNSINDMAGSFDAMEFS